MNSTVREHLPSSPRIRPILADAVAGGAVALIGWTIAVRSMPAERPKTE